MKLVEEQRKVKAILKETISLVCKNGLTFQSKFNIEGLIGITLDDKKVLLISINDLMHKDPPATTTSGGTRACDEEAADTISISGRTPRKKTAKRKIKAEPPEEEVENDDNWITEFDTEARTPNTSQMGNTGEWGDVGQQPKMEFVEDDDSSISDVNDEAWTPKTPGRPQQKRARLHTRQSETRANPRSPKTPERAKSTSRLSIEKKQEMARYYEENTTLKQCQVKTHFEDLWDITIPQSTFNDIIRKYSDPNLLRDREAALRRATESDLEEKLYAWCIEMVSQDTTITRAMLLDKAKEIGKTLNISNTFSFSESWLQGFKRRRDIE